MTKKSSISRRSILAGTAALGVGSLGFPAITRAQGRTVKVGLVHPVTGFLAFNGQQCRAGAVMAIEEINAAGGVKSMGGARLEAMLGDAQSQVAVAVSETTKMAEGGANAFIGCFSSALGLAATQEAAKYNIPFLIDVGVSDNITARGLKNVFRFKAGHSITVDKSVETLDGLNRSKGSPVKSAIIVHEESEFGTVTATRMAAALPRVNIEVKEVIKHANPTRNFDNIALRIRQQRPDAVIISNYLNEYQLLCRTIKQQRVPVKALYSVLGGGFNIRFAREQPDVSQNVMDYNHWYNPRDPRALAFRRRVEAANLFCTFEVMLSYFSVKILHDALERAGTADKDPLINALAASTYSDHFMPYGATRFVNGQNQGAQSVCIQALDRDMKVVFPAEYAEAQAVFPLPT